MSKKALSEILTEETAKLLDRLAGYTSMASDYIMDRGYVGGVYDEDEEAAGVLATKIRELLKGRDENCAGLL